MWKRIITIAHRFGFTRSEAIVIVFIASVIAVGSLIMEVQSKDTAPGTDIRQAYAEADSVFEARSTAVHAVSGDSSHGMDHRMASQPAGRMLNINSASASELIALPGIGPATAEKILRYREEHGRFVSVEDLTKVKSIGPKKLDNIRQFITVE